MSAQTSIEWTDRTWNPVRGCTRVSEGCRNCYAERMAARFSGPGEWAHGFAKRVKVPGIPNDPKYPSTTTGRWTGKVALIPEALDEPLRWKKPQRIFVNSMSDPFHESLSFEHIAAVYGVMAAAGRHTFQVLTKRPQRRLDFHAWLRSDDTPPIARCAYHAGRWRSGTPLRIAQPFTFPDNKVWPLPNVWEGASVEDQATADERIPLLLQTPAVVRFVSQEPQLAAITHRREWLPERGEFIAFDQATADAYSVPRGKKIPVRISDGPKLDWLIVGGESGPGARPFELAWARSARDQCRAAGVAFFMKQVGANVREPSPNGDPGLIQWTFTGKGGDMEEWPEDLRVREFPKVAA